MRVRIANEPDEGECGRRLGQPGPAQQHTGERAIERHQLTKTLEKSFRCPGSDPGGDPRLHHPGRCHQGRVDLFLVHDHSGGLLRLRLGLLPRRGALDDRHRARRGRQPQRRVDAGQLAQDGERRPDAVGRPDRAPRLPRGQRLHPPHDFLGGRRRSGDLRRRWRRHGSGDGHLHLGRHRRWLGPRVEQDQAAPAARATAPRRTRPLCAWATTTRTGSTRRSCRSIPR